MRRTPRGRGVGGLTSAMLAADAGALRDSGKRRRLRRAICITSNGSKVDLSVGMAVSHAGACGPDGGSNSAW